MAEHSEWPDDNLIADLIFRMRSEYTELLMHELEDMDTALLSRAGNPMDVDTRLWVDATEILLLSPPRIWDAFQSFEGVGGEGHDSRVDERVRAIEDALTDWDGPAAQAFVEHVGHIRSFLQFQRGYVDNLLLGYAAAYKHSVQVRESYKTLVEGWIEVSRQYREDADQRDRAVKIKMAVGVLAAMAAVGSGGAILAMGLGSASALAGAAAEDVTADLGGDTGEDVWKLYEKAYGNLVEANRTGMEQIRKFIQDANDHIRDETVLLWKPLPSTTDVDSPDFSYGAFYHDEIGTDYSRDVEAERKRNLDQKNAAGFRQDGPIAFVLSGSTATEDRVENE